MAAILLSYFCEVAVGGYKWWQTRPGINTQTGESVPEGLWDSETDDVEHAVLFNKFRNFDYPGDETTRVQLDDSALFLRIAAMQPTMDEIVEVANQYGPIFRVNYDSWEYEVRILRFMVELWQAVLGARRTGFIAQHFKGDKSGNISCPCQELTNRLMQSTPFEDAFHGDKPKRGNPKRGEHNFHIGTPMSAAREFLHRAVAVLITRCRCSPQFHRRGNSYEIAFQPENARTALWLQFALAVAEDKQFRQCEMCGRSFELSPDVNRKSRLYCTNACRVKAYRHRKAKAHRLHAKGKTLRQIAVELESDTETIKAWLNSGKEFKKGPKR